MGSWRYELLDPEGETRIVKAKSPNLAFTLNFFLPGAGLWYLGKGKYGLINFASVLLIGVGLGLFLQDDVFERHRGLFAAGLAGGSGGLAMAMATQMNARSKDGRQSK